MYSFRDKQFWRVNLPSALESGKSVTVNVVATFTHALSPFPRKIAQAEKQYVIFNANLYVYSPYTVKSQETTVTTASSTIESYTKVKPFTQTESTISYGPYEDKDAISEVSGILVLLVVSVSKYCYGILVYVYLHI